MLYWIVLLVFFIPLVIYILDSKNSERSRVNRLDSIQKRLKEKQLEKIEEKKARIDRKGQ